MLHYRGDEHFARVVGGFIREGLEREESVAVAESPRMIAVLRDTLGTDADDVAFVDLPEFAGSNPARIIAFWHRFLARETAAARPIRGVGQPAWPGRREAELSEVRIHEFLVNRIFDGGPAWRLLCPYDADGLPGEVLDASLRTHPVELTADGRVPTDGYRDAATLEAFAAPLGPVPSAADLLEFAVDQISDVRQAVRQAAGAFDLDPLRVEDLVVASSEIATNSAVHADGGSMRAWRDADGLQLQFTDAGHMREPLVGRRIPDATVVGGRGVYLANQLVDLVQIRSSSAGTTVRLTTWLA